MCLPPFSYTGELLALVQSCGRHQVLTDAWKMQVRPGASADDVKTIYMILMFMERWGPAAGCGDCSLVDWKDSSEGAEETEVRKRFHSETVRGKKK